MGYDDRANLLFTNNRNAVLTKDYPKAIIRLYENPELRKQIAENAEKDIYVMTWKEIASEFDKAFRTFLPSGQGHGMRSH